MSGAGSVPWPSGIAASAAGAARGRPTRTGREGDQSHREFAGSSHPPVPLPAASCASRSLSLPPPSDSALGPRKPGSEPLSAELPPRSSQQAPPGLHPASGKRLGQEGPATWVRPPHPRAPLACLPAWEGLHSLGSPWASFSSPQHFLGRSASTPDRLPQVSWCLVHSCSGRLRPAASWDLS